MSATLIFVTFGWVGSFCGQILKRIWTIGSRESITNFDLGFPFREER